jgi:hypothetical protein
MIIVASAGENGPIVVGHASDILGLRHATQGEELQLIAKIRSDDVDVVRQRLVRFAHRSAVVYERSPELLREIDEIVAESWRG